MSPRMDRNGVNDSKNKNHRVTKSYNFDGGVSGGVGGMQKM